MIQRQRRGAEATRQLTRAYAERVAELVPVLRAELPTPGRPSGSPVLVVLMGVPGVGKSHCARLLCAQVGAAHVSSDHLRTRLFIAPSYAPEESATIFAAANALCDLLLEEGHRVVLDATNLRAAQREHATALARERGVPLVHVRVVAPDGDVRARLAERQLARRAGDHSEADLAVLARMPAFEPPAGGHLELRNGPELPSELLRIAREVERACAPAS